MQSLWLVFQVLLLRQFPKFHKSPHEGPQELQSHFNSSSPVGYWLVLQQMGKQQVFMGKSRSFNHKCAIFKIYVKLPESISFGLRPFGDTLMCFVSTHFLGWSIASLGDSDSRDPWRNLTCQLKCRWGRPSYQLVSKPHQVMMVTSCWLQTGRCSTLTIVMMMMMMMNIIITSSHHHIKTSWSSYTKIRHPLWTICWLG